MKNYLIIPECSERVSAGQKYLNELQVQAELLTTELSRLRSEGFKKVTYEQVLKSLSLHNPERAKGVEAAMFRFTGRRVVPDERAFFDWYETTPEGAAYRESASEQLPEIYGSFARVIL